MKPFQSDGTFHPIATGHELRRTAVRGAVAAMTGSAGSFIVAIGSVVILARLLTPSDFGVVTMVSTFSLLLRSFGLNGFTELIMQREKMTDSLASNLFWVNLGVGSILTVAFAGSGPLLARFFHNTEVIQVTRGMSLTIVIGCLGYIHTGLLQRAMHFRTTAIINLTGNAVQFVVSVLLALTGLHYWALVWGSVAQTCVLAFGAWLACRWLPSRPGYAAGTGSGLMFALNVYSHFAFVYLTRNTDNFLVGRRFGAQALGFYKKAYDLFVLPETLMMAPISAVVVTTLSRVSRDREKFQEYFLRVISVLALFGMAVGVDLALVGADVIRFMFGPRWGETGRIFALFAPGIGVGLLYYAHSWVHLSIGRPERWFRWGLLEFAITASLFLLGLRWGPSGVALAWTTSYFLLVLPGLAYAGKPIGLGIGSIFAVIWKFFAASIAAGIGTGLIVRATPYFGMLAVSGARGAFVRMVTVSLVFVALYLAMIVALHQGLKPLRDTASLVRMMPESNKTSTPEVVDADAVLANAPAATDVLSREVAVPPDSEFKA